MITAMQAWAISVVSKSDKYKNIERQIVSAAKEGKTGTSVRLYEERGNLTDAEWAECNAIEIDLQRLGYSLGRCDDDGILLIRFHGSV